MNNFANDFHESLNQAARPQTNNGQVPLDQKLRPNSYK